VKRNIWVVAMIDVNYGETTYLVDVKQLAFANGKVYFQERYPDVERERNGKRGQITLSSTVQAEVEGYLTALHQQGELEEPQRGEVCGWEWTTHPGYELEEGDLCLSFREEHLFNTCLERAEHGETSILSAVASVKMIGGGDAGQTLEERAEGLFVVVLKG
jgi:hypothetical protein